MSSELIRQYEEHLTLVRNLQENSVRGYVSDLQSLLAYLQENGVDEFSQLDLSHLRGWLAELATYSYAIKLGFRPPLEGVPYLKAIVTFGGFFVTIILLGVSTSFLLLIKYYVLNHGVPHKIAYEGHKRC